MKKKTLLSEVQQLQKIAGLLKEEDLNLSDAPSFGPDYVIVQGGSRGEIEDVYEVESPLSFEEFCASRGKEVLANFMDGFDTEEEAQQYAKEFNVGMLEFNQDRSVCSISENEEEGIAILNPAKIDPSKIQILLDPDTSNEEIYNIMNSLDAY